MKRLKKLICVILALSMATGLCACGPLKGFGNKGNDGTENNPKNKFSSSPELAKQNVYKLQEIDFSSLAKEGSSMNVQSLNKVGDKIYAMTNSYSYDGEYYGAAAQEYILISMNVDGSDVKSTKLELLEGDETETETADTLASSKRVPITDSVDSDEIEMPEQSRYEYSNYGNFRITDEGYIFGTRSYNLEDYSDPDNYVSERTESVCCWDMDGKLLRSTVLDFFSNNSDGWYYINKLVGAPDGAVNVLVYGDQSGVITVDKEGNASELKQAKGMEKFAQNFSGMYVLPDGKIVVSYYGDDWNRLYLTTYDPDTDKTSDEVELPATIAYNMYGNFAVDGEQNLYFSNDKGVYKYHIGDEKEELLMSYVNSDLYIDSLDTILPLNDEQFIGTYYEYDEQYNSTLKGGIFTRVKPEDVPEKKVLVLGGSYLYGDIKKRVVDYNKSNSEYKIVLKDYSQYNSYDDYSASFTQMNNDIISGNMPDIIVVSGYNMPIDNYISKGLLADVGALIEKDEELSKIDFVDNVFEAYKVDGKLYEVIPSFTVSTYIAKKSIVGERNGWTMNEAREILAGLPEGTNLFGDTTRDQFISVMMEFCGGEFVDVSTGKCNFDSDEFIAMLEYAKTLPESIDEADYNEGWYKNYESQYRENRTVLGRQYISEVTDLVTVINGSFGEDVSFVGFPSENGNGSVINADTTYALAANSENLDVAWNFIRYYLTDEYQSSLQWTISVHEKYLKENAQKATKLRSYTYGDETTEEPYYYWINEEEIEVDPLTQDQADEIVAFLLTVDRKAYNNSDVTNIINEEVGAFFKNQKTAKDVASVIQSRVQLYVNENR